MNELDPIALNVLGPSELVQSPMNKVPTGATGQNEGPQGEQIDVLALDLTDDELLELRNKWVAQYAGYEQQINAVSKANKAYYLGKENSGDMGGKPLAGNYIFEAEETFLPAALAKNPDPVVYSDNSEEGNKLASDVKTMLQYHADTLVLRRKLSMMVRQWSIYHLGVLKYGWDEEINDVTIQNRKIQDFIFDKNGHVDAYGDFTSYLGERITVSADKLVELFPQHRAYITIMVDGKMGTDCTYTEWWTDEFCFTTYKEKILDKHKNEFFKYPEADEDEYGLPISTDARNHFAKPKKPYTFLSVFSLGEQPHDITGLIEQNIPNQNLVTKRTYQLDYNLSKSNNSDVFSENNFNQETAKQAAQAMMKGNPVLIPQGGPISEAIERLPAPGVDASFFKEQENNITALRSSFGTQGISSQEPNQDTTARGMILNQQYDNSRIGGGIGESIEQVADNTFNWLVQLYYVFYDEKHFAAVMGQMKAVEYVMLSSQNLDRQLIVSVSPDSMKPKDEITEMNQALELWKEGALDPKTLLTVLNFPDPQETAAQVVLWRTSPQLYMQLNFPDLQAQIQSEQMEAQAMAGAGGETPAPMPGQEAAGQPDAAIQGEEPTGGAGVEANPALSQVPLPQ